MNYKSKNSENFLGYTKLAIVGKGAFGTAVLYKRERDTTEVVIKEVNLMDMPMEEKKSALNEVKVLSSLNHPNIIRYFGSFEQDGCLYIEMEYADGGTLAQLLDVRFQQNKKLKERDILCLFRQITGAIGHMHSHKILHRDLKTANIFLTKKGEAKVGDFGISKMMSTLVQAQTVVGTPYYLSPEMCEGKDYDEKSDIWALGCILYEMVELRKPFEANNLPALVNRITACDFEPISKNYSNELQELINSMIQKNPIQRPCAQTVYSSIIPKIILEIENKKYEELLAHSEGKIITERTVLYELKSFKNEINLEPVQLPVSKLINVAVGNTHCLAVTEDSLVYSWGENKYGQLGLGEIVPYRKYPIRIDSLTGKNIKQVAAGNSFSIFLNNIGLMMTCGDGSQGCLGQGDWNSVTIPRIINRMVSVNVVQVSCGPDHVMALTANGDLYSWGCGKGGRLGLGDESHRCSPVLVKIPVDHKIKSVYCGGDASLVVTTNGQLLACGQNTSNKLGLSTIFQQCEKSLYFVPVKSIKSKIKDISIGQHHIILITENGTAISMGRNKEGQLGRGNFKTKFTPEVISGVPSRIMVASCSSTYTIAGTVDNVVYFWGTRYNTDNKKMWKSKDSTSSMGSMLKQTFVNIAEDSFSTTSTSVTFNSDIVKNCDQEVIKKPKPILGLYASPSHIAAGELVWLVKIFSSENIIYVWVNTTAPPAKSRNNYSRKETTVPTWVNFEELKKELSTLPNTPQPIN